MTRSKSNKKSQKPDNSTSDNAIKVAWIGFSGVLLAALIAAGVALFLQQQNKPSIAAQQPASTVVNQTVGNNNKGTVNQAGGDIKNEK